MLAIGLMFSLSRGITKINTGVKAGGWERVIGFELTGKKLGLIGGGQIGKEVAKRACGLEMSVAIYDPYFSDDTFLNKYGITCAFTHEAVENMAMAATLNLLEMLEKKNS